MSKYFNEFLEDLKIHRSYNTFVAYKKDLQIYNLFLKNHTDISLLYEHIDKKGLGSRSKARIISSVRSYLRFLESKGVKTQLHKLICVPIKTQLPKLISPTEFTKIYKASYVKTESKTARNHITLLLLFGLGCRISEIIQLNLQDISALDCCLIVTGKRNKQRILPLTQDLFTKLNEYIQQYRPALVKSSNNTSVLINNRGQRPSRIDIWRWLSLWSKKAGFLNVKSPHQFRHGFATTLLENGTDLRSIQCLLGHSSIHTTQIYTSVKKELLKKTINNHHPLSALTIKSKI